MSPHWSDHAPSTLLSDYVHRNETTPLVYEMDLLLQTILSQADVKVVVDIDQLV
jgi:hypothetical protein